MEGSVWVGLISVLVSGGLLGYVADFLKQRRISRETPKPVREQITANSATDSSLTIVARARDELAEDLERQRGVVADERANAQVLRDTLYREREQRAQEMARITETHARERADWEAREQRYLQRIASLEERMNELLDEIHRLKADVERGDG